MEEETQTRVESGSADLNPESTATPSFPEIEEEILRFWEKDGTFQASIDVRPPTHGASSNEFVFYDGPPFANGLPHYGHLATGFVKDIIPRYRTMRGQRVERRFGWDTHGLPAELQAEKELGVSGRHEILRLGIEKFNQHCRSSVLQFTKEWRQYVRRQARWVDFDHDYKTLDQSFMESVLWAFKTLYDRGLIYEGYRVVPYSWAIESPLSNFETRLDDSYRPRQDPAVTIAFALDPQPGDEGPMRLWVWTTTPWTLPSNLALAVGPDVDYAVYRKDGERWILGAAAAERYARELEGAEKVGEIKGSALVGRTYRPLFPYFSDTANAFRVLGGDFIDVAEGTGTVHIAPGFGEDDINVATKNGIPVVVPVDASGKFTDEVPDYKGMLVFDANKPIVRQLRDSGVLVRHETYTHNYPHCWRTDQPLIYKAINSWYLQVTAFRDRMTELNRTINWIPSHVRDGLFGNWLENARDWNISRNRFWGTPLPVWKSDNPDYPRVDVYGSIAELERDFGVRLKDLHRPYIDELVRPNPDDPTGKSTMRRISDVLDCWFESGSMPFAQVHYPFENKDWFEKHFPGDFIVEYIAQTRGWFYTMVVLGTALFDRAPFRNCLCHGVVLDEQHRKLSKRMQNYPDPLEVFDTYGADALRWYMVSSPLMAGGDVSISKDGSVIGQAQRQVIKPMWNAYAFYTLYANADRCSGKVINEASSVLDRYILAKTRELIEQVQNRLDAYDLPSACARLTDYMEALNNWYIRRSRSRFWGAEKTRDKQDAYDTLFTALTMLCRTAAPLLPLTTEKVYKGLTGERSVHLTRWPDYASLAGDPQLVGTMDRVREICSAVLAVREQHNLRVRLPLSRVIVVDQDVDRIKPFTDLIAEEVNVKEVVLERELTAYGTIELVVNSRVVGKRMGNAMKAVLAASKEGRWEDNGNGTVQVADQTLGDGEFTLRLRLKEGSAGQSLSKQGAVLLDVSVTPELEREGLARDLMRVIQQTRKQAGLGISDRIRLRLELPKDFHPAVEAHRELIQEETLATELALGDAAVADYQAGHDVQGKKVSVGVSKIG